MKPQAFFKTVRRWFSDTPDRALERAYRAALTIEAMEDDYFNGNRVCPEENEYSDRIFSYCETEVKKNLAIAKRSLAEFKATRSILGSSDAQESYSIEDWDAEVREQSAIIIEKLDFIDKVISKYETKKKKNDKLSVSLVEIPKNSPQNSQRQVAKVENNKNIANREIELNKNKLSSVKNNSGENPGTISDKAGVLPRSLLNTLSRIQREIDPKSQDSEEEILKKFRQSRNRTAVSIRFLLILVIVPLLVHQLTKTFIIAPIVESRFFQNDSQLIFLNENMQEEALQELSHFEESLHFKFLLGMGEQMSPEETEAEVKHKAQEIAENFRHQGAAAISNIFADVCSLIAFTWVVFISRREILMLKSFLDEIIYGLSDSAKSFLIILFTDMFVGFHSPHGWEIILEGVSRHFGLPESRDFNFLFIATFPVILDTVLKYWIFRYLNRISPSAVATYKTMNE